MEKATDSVHAFADEQHFEHYELLMRAKKNYAQIKCKNFVYSQKEVPLWLTL